VSMNYGPKGHKRWGSVHSVAFHAREERSCSSRARTLDQAGQVRMACWKVAGSFSKWGQVRSGFSLNKQVCAPL